MTNYGINVCLLDSFVFSLGFFNVILNDISYQWTYGLQVEGRKEGNVSLTTHTTHFIYGYMVSDIW